MEEQRNLWIAIVLAIVILMGWQFFVSPNTIEQQRFKEVPSNTHSFDTKLNQNTKILQEKDISPRINIDTKRITGSIRLRGALIDDIRLKDYHDEKNNTLISIFKTKLLL